MKNIGAVIKKKRSSMGKSQEWLGNHLWPHISENAKQSRISRIEGGYIPKQEHLDKILKILGIEINDVADEEAEAKDLKQQLIDKDKKIAELEGVIKGIEMAMGQSPFHSSPAGKKG